MHFSLLQVISVILSAVCTIYLLEKLEMVEVFTSLPADWRTKDVRGFTQVCLMFSEETSIGFDFMHIIYIISSINV